MFPVLEERHNRKTGRKLACIWERFATWMRLMKPTNCRPQSFSRTQRSAQIRGICLLRTCFTCTRLSFTNDKFIQNYQATDSTVCESRMSAKATREMTNESNQTFPAKSSNTFLFASSFFFVRLFRKHIHIIIWVYFVNRPIRVCLCVCIDAADWRTELNACAKICLHSRR